ncbi:hypothetical protein AVEN_124436-1 [Araneus ventricosus]|uniref:Uncharacterized protein n=1 Tax=Araneus ventricosus TaxID=182803 RepID=A0A4Y2HW88_ARAVE|nr:hypothetical protein AVEN_124436-1 [Araneus ventricosus]
MRNYKILCSGFESKDSDLSADHHAADLRRAWRAVNVNQLVATGGFITSGDIRRRSTENSLFLAFFFPGCLHPVAPVVDASFICILEAMGLPEHA